VSEPLSEAARTLLDAGANHSRKLFVPDLFYVECANILWKRVRRLGLSANDAQRAMQDLLALALDVTPTEQLTLASLPLALDLGITAYDACYVELARRQAVPLVTADQALIRKAAGRFDVQWLGA
jgi:predicted nucleic acid-binding protein